MAMPNEAVPVGDHDVAMHAVVTEAGIIACAAADPMPHTIEPAASARAKCRACGTKIGKGVLRFGERVDNPYGDGLATYWFHLRCGALRRPEPFAALLRARPDLALDARDRLVADADLGLAHHRLARLTQAMPAPSGRARCRHCRALIAKGQWRCSLSIWQDGRFEAMGFIHATCAQAHFKCTDGAALLSRAAHGSPDLDPDALAVLAACLMTPADDAPGDAAVDVPGAAASDATGAETES